MNRVIRMTALALCCAVLFPLTAHAQVTCSRAQSAELRAEEDSREENRKGRERDRDFSGQRHREGSQYAGNRGAEGAENEIMCCHFHVVVNLRIV